MGSIIDGSPDSIKKWGVPAHAAGATVRLGFKGNSGRTERNEYHFMEIIAQKMRSVNCPGIAVLSGMFDYGFQPALLYGDFEPRCKIEIAASLIKRRFDRRR